MNATKTSTEPALNVVAKLISDTLTTDFTTANFIPISTVINFVLVAEQISCTLARVEDNRANERTKRFNVTYYQKHQHYINACVYVYFNS